MRETEEVDATVRRIEELIETLGEADPRMRELSEEAIRLLMQLYGAAFRRIVETVGSSEAERLAEDKLVSSLLLLHGLHPVPAETRVREALRQVERRLDGVHLVLENVEEGAVVRVRVDPNGGPAPAASLGPVIESAISERAPEIRAVEIEGLHETLVQIT